MPKLSLAKLERHLYSAADRLRQEGLDAATYKDYIFGMLFLKRCSDVFAHDREKLVSRKVQQGMARDEAEERYGENADYYKTFFVPKNARWSYLQDKLNDAAGAPNAEDGDARPQFLVADAGCADIYRHFILLGRASFSPFCTPRTAQLIRLFFF